MPSIHRHHIVPKHAGGTDNPENLVELTLAEHAEAHRILWEQHGRLQDKVAWLMLSGKTEEGELARRELSRKYMMTRIISNETRQQMSKSQKRRHQLNPNLSRTMRTISSGFTEKRHSIESIEKANNARAIRVAERHANESRSWARWEKI